VEWYQSRGLLKEIDASPAPETVMKELKELLGH